MKNNIKNSINSNFTLLHFTCLKNVKGGVLNPTYPYFIMNIKEINT